MQYNDNYCKIEIPEQSDELTLNHSCHKSHHEKYERDNTAKCGNNIYIYPPMMPLAPIVRALKFAQTRDMNLNVSMTEPGNIQLVSAPDQLMEKGGFTLLSDEVPNDTLVFPELGVYRLDINMKYSFLPKLSTPMNMFYQVIVEPTLDGRYLPALSMNSGVTSTETNQGILSSCLMVNVLKKDTELKLYLDEFTFDVAFKSEVNIYDILVGITQMDPTPIS